MSFIYPQFLYGLFALSIPIIIHLFNFRRRRKVYYSSTEFLKNIQEASTSKLKIKHWLILLSRLLFITALVLAFAQPFIPAQEQRSSDPDIYIYLDNSASMTNEVSTDFHGIDAGISYINQLPALFPAGTRYKLLTNDFASYSNFFVTGEELTDLTTEINADAAVRSTSEIWNRLQSGIEESPKKDIFWISDFQKSTSGSLQELALDSTVRINLIPIEFESESNLFVDSVYLNNPFFFGQDNVALTVVVRNSGFTDRTRVPIKVFLNEIQSSNATIDINANSRQEIVFDLGFELDKVSQGRVSIEDYPVTFDNDFYFTIDRANKVDIVEVKSGLETSPFESVFGNQDLFTFSSFTTGNIDYNRLQNADLIVLNQLDVIDPSLIAVAGNFLSNGGSVALVPGPQPDVSSFQQLVGRRSVQRRDSLFARNLDSPDMSNPFFENVFEERSNRVAMPPATQTLAWGQDRAALLSFRNGEPFLSQIANMGSLYLFAGPLSDSFTGFHNHALFVPIMYKMAIYSQKDFSNLYYSISDPQVVLKIDSVDQNTLIKMERDGEAFIPSQRLVAGSMLMELPQDVVQQGFYSIMKDENPLTSVAFNIDSKESLLQQFTASEIENTFAQQPNITSYSSTTEQEFAKAVRNQYEGIPLWKFAITLALIFLMAEVLLIRFL